jgi:hypothetical protein
MIESFEKPLGPVTRDWSSKPASAVLAKGVPGAVVCHRHEIAGLAIEGAGDSFLNAEDGEGYGEEDAAEPSHWPCLAIDDRACRESRARVILQGEWPPGCRGTLDGMQRKTSRKS